MALVGELVAGAALGTVFSELYRGVKKLWKNNKPLLDDLQITLDSLKPIVDEMRDCNDERDPSCNEIAAFYSKIEEGVKLVCKLSTVDKWYKNRTCTKQLVELDGSLKTHLKVLTVQAARDGKKTRISAKKIEKQLNLVVDVVRNQVENKAWCAPPPTVGSDVKSMLVQTAPDGSLRDTILRTVKGFHLEKILGSSSSHIHISATLITLVKIKIKIEQENNMLKFPPKLYDFVLLKNFSITNFHKLSTLPEEVGNLINLEVLRLNSCSKLSELPGSVTSLNKLNFLDISDCYSITELPEDIGNMSSLRKLNMTRCSKVNKLPLSVVYLDQLEGVVCDQETKKLWEPFLPYLENLRIEMAQENRFLKQTNLIVVRMQKRDVMNKIVQSHVSSVRFDLQEEVKALGEKLTDKLDNFMAQIINHIQRKNEMDWKGMSELEWDDVNISESTIVSRRIDSEVQARELTLRKFNAWLDDPSAGWHNLEIFEASKEWFIDLMTAGMWLSDSHVDVFLHFARKNSYLPSQHFSPSCAIMDTVFWSWMNGRWDAFQHNHDSYNWDSDMLDYPLGKSPKHSRPWSAVESVSIPIQIYIHVHIYECRSL
ncbi:unnamed protein product [Malus baccata var. baccata]